MRNDEALASQFVRLPRRLVRDGRWAELWRADAGLAVALLPVAALLARGYPEAGALCRLRRLGYLTGLTTTEMRTARRTLERTGLLERAHDPRRGVWRLHITERIRPSSDRRDFHVPGGVVSDGLWATLSSADRSLLIALAASARAYAQPHQLGLEEVEGPIRDWIDEIDAFDVDALEGYGAIRRVGVLAVPELQTLTALSAADVLRAARQLASATGCELVNVLQHGDLIWFHLGAKYWAGNDWAGAQNE